MKKSPFATQYTGRVIGVLIGLFLSGPLGMMLGYGIGYMFDYYSHNFRFQTKNKQNFNTVEQRFYEATFIFLGFLAKSDGRITQPEIKVTENIMERLKLNSQQKQYAMRLFYQGKNKNFDYTKTINRLKPFRAFPYCRQFIQYLSEMVNVDPATQAKKARLFSHICSELGFTTSYGGSSNQQQNSNQQHSRYKPHSYVNSAYSTLGISPNATVKEVRKAYRTQVSKYHPDKLAAKGATEAEIAKATEKTGEINKAYETIMELRGK